MKKSLVVAALCASAVLGGGAHPAQAGHWERLVPVDEYGNDLTGQAYLDWVALHGKLYNGNETVVLASDPLNRDWDDEGTWFHATWGDGVWYSINTFTAFNNTTSDTSTNHVSSGTIRAKYKWVRNKVNGDDDPNDNPPSVLWLKISLSAVAEIAGDRLFSSSTTSLEVSANGVSIPIDVNNGSDGWGSYYMQKITQDNNTQYLLVPVITNGADIVSTPPYPLSVDMDAQFNANASLWTYQKMEFSAKEDDRRLHLTRSGAIGEIVRGNTTYGHSRFSYLDDVETIPSDPPLPSTSVPINQEYVRNISGSWGMDPDWEWSPEGNEDTAIYSIQTNEYGNRNKDMGDNWFGPSTTPRVQTTTYRLQDPNDGTVAEATYELILHDEWENLRPDSEDPYNIQIRYIPEGPSITNQWMKNTSDPDTKTFTWAYEMSYSKGREVGGGLDLNFGDLAALGLTISASEEESVGASFEAESPATRNGFMRYAHIEARWQRKNYLLDHYIPSGHDRNPARVNANGETDATHDGSWKFWVDDPSTLGIEPMWSREYINWDFDGNGTPDPGTPGNP